MGPEAKLKPRRGNGTPHPKGRRSLLQYTPHEEATQNETRSSLQTLLHVHTQVSQTLHQIDTMVLHMHKLASTNHVADAEVRSLADALANFDENLQDWNNFLKASAEQSSCTLNLDQELPTTESLESTPDECASLRPLITDLECCAISYSPLVPSDLDCESPCDSESLMRTPPFKTTLSPSPETPHMLSLPRSIGVLSTIREISPLSLHSSSDCHQTPSPDDTWTPERSTCQSQLVFETPSPYPNDETMLLQTPGFGVSPPRTCNPLRHGEHVAAESVNVPATPVMPSPFRTPGILFECSSDTSESSPPLIVDDLTTSTVKRLGQKGLEERLWQELAIRKADVLRSVQFR